MSGVRLPPDAGLTILELMIVLVILSLIGTVVAVQVVGQLDRAKVDIARLQLRQMQNALALFQVDLRRYPTAEEGLQALLVPPEASESWRGPYVKNADAFSDPWGRALQYRVGQTRGYTLLSFAADGKDQGEGVATDIVLVEDN